MNIIIYLEDLGNCKIFDEALELEQKDSTRDDIIILPSFDFIIYS
jgi:hypothetical protein